MRLLNKPGNVILFHPYVVNICGDEPGLKEMLSFRGGNCKYFCIQCLYKNEDNLYNPKKHYSRNAEVIKKQCALGENSFLRAIAEGGRRKKSTNSRHMEEDAASEWCMEQGIFPMRNAFHDAPMGVK